MTLASILVLIAALVIGVLGTLHLLYTFRGPKLQPRSPELRSAMQSDSPGISRETTMWRAWVGFNASHSLCALLFGFVYGYLAVRQSALLFDTVFLSAVGFANLLSLLVLAKRYWFSVPFTGIAIALLCFLAGHMLANM